jgi:hypothetical protein
MRKRRLLQQVPFMLSMTCSRKIGNCEIFIMTVKSANLQVAGISGR